MSIADKNFFNQYQDSESSPLIYSAQSETCEAMFKRVRHKCRFYLGVTRILAILATAATTYFLNYEKMNTVDPNSCISNRDRKSAIILSLLFGAVGNTN